VPATYKTDDGYRLGGWVGEQRINRDKLSDEQKKRLESLGFLWEPHAVQWENGFEHLKVFASKHGHCRAPQSYKSPDGFKLGQWISVQRTRRDDLSSERKARLDAVGFDWDVIEALWEEGFVHLRDYLEKQNHCYVPALYKSPDGYPLGTWVSFQRVSKDKLSNERLARLDALGFDWNPSATVWREGIKYLEAYANEHKDCLVPTYYKTGDGYQLGTWVTNIRKRRDTLTPEKIAQLDALGLEWRSRHDFQWEAGFEHLQIYVKEHTHSHVPQTYKSPDGFKLGLWCSNQRNRPEALTAERKARLEELKSPRFGKRAFRLLNSFHVEKVIAKCLADTEPRTVIS
jgi:hypothetical protein